MFNYTKWKAKRKLLKSRQEDVEVYKILEAFLTEQILDGQTQRRPELLQMQKRIEENNKFIAFIKKL